MIGIGEHLARASLCLLQGYGRRYVRTSAGNIHLLEARGSGVLPPLVVLHGLSSAGVHYLWMLRHLGGFSRVVLPDLPGHGFSDTPPRLDERALLQGLFEALDRVLDRPAVLCGTSLGGYTAIRYALARPANVRALMLASPAGASMASAQLRALRQRFELGSHREALDFTDTLFARRRRIRHLYALGMRRYFSLPQTRAVLETMQRAHLFTPEQLAALAMPVLLVWGGAERILTLDQLDFFRAHLPPHAVVERPAHWGHAPFLDDPRGFAQRLVEFAATV